MGTDIITELAKEQKAFENECLEEKFKYKQHILDLSQPTNEANFLFSIGGINTIPEGELVGVKGRAKMGKSQFEYYLIAAMLSGERKGAVKPLQKEYKVLLFDTEQSQASLKKCCQRALNYASLPIDKNDGRFLPFFMRPLSIDDRRKVIEDAIREEKPNIVFIDGIRDLIQDFNSLEQSSELIQWLLGLTAEHGCTIVSVLHQNKSKEDGNMRGHLGTELLNKLTDCFEVSKKEGKFIVSCTDSRNVPCPELAFSIDINGDFKEEETCNESKEREKVAEILNILKTCFTKKSSYGFRELVQAYAMEACVSESTAKRRLGEAKKNDAIIVGSDGLYQLNPQHG